MPPIYNYECTVCGTEQELLLKMIDAEPEKKLFCEECNLHHLHRRIIGASFVRFKGPGWMTPRHGDK